MANESTRHDGEHITLYKLDWTNQDLLPVQVRYDGVHVSPVRQKDLSPEYATLMQENEVYIFVDSTSSFIDEKDYDGAIPFEAMQEKHPFHYGGLTDDEVTLLGAEDIGTDDLPEDLYTEMKQIVNDRDFNVQSLASVYREQETKHPVEPERKKMKL